MCVNLGNYARNCVVFQENLHSWHKFYTTAGRYGRDKSHLWQEVDFQGVCLKGRVKIKIRLIFEGRIMAGVTLPSPLGGENYKFYTSVRLTHISL